MDSKNDEAEMPEGFVFVPFESAGLDQEIRLKFVRTFRETWEMLPDDMRTVMFKQIADDGDVDIELRDDHPRFRLGPSGNADAQFFYRGTHREILFRCDKARVLEEGVSIIGSLTNWLTFTCTSWTSPTERTARRMNRTLGISWRLHGVTHLMTASTVTNLDRWFPRNTNGRVHF